MAASPHQTLPLDVALRQAVAHHQAGRLQEAEQLYRAILQAQPYQPDANHNLGVLAAGQVGQHAAGLPYLKTALAINFGSGWGTVIDIRRNALRGLRPTGYALRALNFARLCNCNPRRSHHVNYHRSDD